MSDAIDDIDIASLDEAALRRLIQAGEPGGVELKAIVPKEGLAPSIAAFANSGGGWLLLGVTDDGRIAGFDVPGRSDAHDWVRDRLQHALDPPPEFRTAVHPTAEGSVLAIRVPASSRTPHVLRGSGVVYERVSGGKRPIDSQGKLIAMCESPRSAEEQAVGRLTRLPLIRDALETRMGGEVANGQTRVADWHVGATPLHVPSDFAGSVMSRSAVGTVEKSAVGALRVLAESGVQLSAHVTPLSRGYIVLGRSNVTRDELAVTADAGGAVVARWSTRLFRGTHHLPGLGDQVLRPLLDAALAVLAAGRVESEILLHLYLTITPADRNYEPILVVSAATLAGELRAQVGKPLFVGGRIATITETERARQVDAWWRELGRAAGLALWEP